MISKNTVSFRQLYITESKAVLVRMNAVTLLKLPKFSWSSASRHTKRFRKCFGEFLFECLRQSLRAYLIKIDCWVGIKDHIIAYNIMQYECNI